MRTDMDVRGVFNGGRYRCKHNKTERNDSKLIKEKFNLEFEHEWALLTPSGWISRVWKLISGPQSDGELEDYHPPTSGV